MSERTLLIRSADGMQSYALLEEQSLLEYGLPAASGGLSVGQIIVGLVERVLPDLGAAFVRIGQDKNGFLPLKESPSFHDLPHLPLVTGNTVTVQVKKEGKGEKGAYLTRDISLVGQYVILMPENRFIGVSKRLENDSRSAALRTFGRKLANQRFGLIMREAACTADKTTVAEEAEQLYAEWQEIAGKVNYVKAPYYVERMTQGWNACLRNYGSRHQIRVFADFKKPDDALACAEWNTISAEEMNLLWKRSHVQTQLKSTLSRRIPLSGGSELVIDEREALTTIDVNSAHNVASESTELAFEQNMACVKEIARIIRLRNLSGILIVDFINMDSDKHREQLCKAMCEAVDDDSVKTVVHGLTSLGLLEMTRKRTGGSLLESCSEPCGCCSESGRRIAVEF